jgi:hypothetical protein
MAVLLAAREMEMGEQEDKERQMLIDTWKLFAEASANEKKWMYERLNWLLVSQPILFATIALAPKPEGCGPANTNGSLLLARANDLGRRRCRVGNICFCRCELSRCRGHALAVDRRTATTREGNWNKIS